VSQKDRERCRVLVTGATGAIGPRVVNTLYEAGYDVRTFSLEPPSAGLFPPEVEIGTGDIRNADAVRSAMIGVDSVVHLAALLHIANPPQHLRTKYEQVNVGGTENVIEAATSAGNVRRVVLFSTIAVYGPTSGEIVCEESIPCPNTFYAQTKLEAEKIVLNAEKQNGGSLGTVLRLAAVYGSRIKGNYQRLFRSLASGHFIPIGDGSNRRTLVYDKDVAEAALVVLKHPKAAGNIYNLSDGAYHSVEEIIVAICHALERRPPKFSLPLAPVRVSVGFAEDVTRFFGFEPPISRATVDKYTEDIAVDASRIQEELGFLPQYDLFEGWQDAVREMKISDEF